MKARGLARSLEARRPRLFPLPCPKFKIEAHRVNEGVRVIDTT
jgi:hypothetical protein